MSELKLPEHDFVLAAPRYLARLALGLLISLGLLGSFNYVVDPFYLFASPNREGVNELRTQFFNSQLLSKPYAIERRQPNALMLGSSRTGTALRPDHPGLADYDTYNGALAGSTMRANVLQYQHASAIRPLELVLFNPDFYMFNAWQRPPNRRAYMDFEKRLRVNRDGSHNLQRWPMAISDYFDTMLAWNTFKNSVMTMTGQARVERGETPYLTIHPDGHWTNRVAEQRRHRSYFKQVERIYIPGGWVPTDSFRYALRQEGNDGSNPIDDFRWMLNDAYQQGTRVIITFMPYHARLLEAMHSIGIWPQSEDWKRTVVSLVEELAALNGKTPFQIWDFTGYTEVNMEALPERTLTGNNMRWYRDASHVQQHTGDLILDRILGVDGKNPIPEDFGVRIDSRNIEAHLAWINSQRQRFLKERADDVAEIQAMVEAAGAAQVVR